MGFYSSRATFACALLVAGACSRRDHTDAAALPPPPRAEFLVATQDSTFWVSTNGRAIRTRGAPLTLAQYDGHFFEVFLADDDRSYADALLVGLRVYRRDLLQGDSTIVFEDSIVPRIAREYGHAHPDAHRLSPDEDGSEDPATQAMADLQVVDLHGPYLSFEYHVDISQRGAAPWHSTRRGVIDLRAARPTQLTDLFPPPVAAALVDSGKRELAAAVDSLRGDSRDNARRAVNALSKVHFDDRSFVLTVPDSQLAVEFDVPQRGIDVPDEVIPLDALRPSAPEWWNAVAPTFARAQDDLDRWPRASSNGYDVLARYDSSTENARLSISDGKHEWPVRVVGAPVLHVFWLDRSPVDSAARRALARAFDDASLYDEATRTVRLPRAAHQPVRVRFAVSRPRVRHSSRHRA